MRGILVSVGLDVPLDWIWRCFKRWGWSFKKPFYKQINKFTAANCMYTGHYLLTIAAINPIHLKYLDESHFDSKGLRRSKGVSEIGRPIVAVSNSSISERYSITAVTTLADQKNPVVLSDVRVGTNSAMDFLLLFFGSSLTTRSLLVTIWYWTTRVFITRLRSALYSTLC